MSIPAKIAASLDSQRDYYEELYKHFHRTPEISSAEHNTAERIEQELRALGLEPIRIGGTGVVAVVANGEGPTIVARADIDGLPLAEAEKVDYRSQNEGVMHGCGHDFHITAELAATRALVENRDAWHGTYVALFQPAEETASGAKAMVDDGLVDKLPRPDVVVGQHIMPGQPGVVRIGAGPMMSVADWVKVTIHGRGAHGSMPHNSVDPVVLASAIVMRLQTVISREVQPGTFSVLTVGSIHAGTSANIIPAEATLQLNLRHYDDAVRARVVAAMERIITGECEAAGAPEPPTIEYVHQAPLLVNDPEHTERLRQAFVDEFGADGVLAQERSTASEDFAVLPNAWGVPYVYWNVGGTDAAVWDKAVAEDTVAETVPVNHSPWFIPTLHPTLEAMTRAQVAAALAYLGK